MAFIGSELHTWVVAHIARVDRLHHAGFSRGAAIGTVVAQGRWRRSRLTGVDPGTPCGTLRTMPTESPITSRARVILALAAHGPLGPTEVQRRAGMANTAQVLLDGLEKAGMVESAPSPPGTKGRPGRVWSLTLQGHQEARDIRGALLAAWGGGEVPVVPQEPSQPAKSWF